MITWCCFIFSVIVQYTSAQTIPYGVPNRATNIGNNARGVPNGMAMSLPNRIGRTISNTANNMAIENIMNRQNLGNLYSTNNNLFNNVPCANAKASNSNFVNALESKLANDITTTALENFANANLITNIAAPVIANLPNGANYNFGNSPIPVTFTGRSHGNNPVGINILADNLEVKGLVTVTGRMPIFGAVTLNGNVPSNGMASVNYGCGSPALSAAV